MIVRSLATKIQSLATQFPVVSLTGPRQSGKTTLLRKLFPDYTYINLEHPAQRMLAQNSPEAFLNQKGKGMIIDEAQYVPALFSYVQVLVDEHKRNGAFILCGSQHFLMMENISQSLAGRAAILHLLPFSLAELADTEYHEAEFLPYLFRGFFPRIYDQQIAPIDYYPSYIQTYLERDARQIVNVSNLGTFQSFLQLCAGRVGQLFNQSEIGSQIGVDQKTARKWLSILETGFQAFTLRPYFNNYNKRIVKTPKLYFWDTGLACSLLGIQTAAELQNHYARGALFENFVIVEMIKQFYHRGVRPNVYFWRDHSGREIDLLIDQGGRLFPFEIKSGETLREDWFKNLNFFQKLSGTPAERTYLIYGGSLRLDDERARIRPWNQLPEIG